MTLLNLIKITFYKSPEHVLFSQQSCPPATPRLVPTSFPLTGNKPTWSSPDLWPDHRETGWLSGGVTVDGVRMFHSITSHLLHLTHPFSAFPPEKFESGPPKVTSMPVWTWACLAPCNHSWIHCILPGVLSLRGAKGPEAPHFPRPGGPAWSGGLTCGPQALLPTPQGVRCPCSPQPRAWGQGVAPSSLPHHSQPLHHRASKPSPGLTARPESLFLGWIMTVRHY